MNIIFSTPEMPMCPAETSLSADEAHRLNALPSAVLTNNTHHLLGCGFAVHDTGTPHSALAELQEASPTGNVLWWLIWNDDGMREIRIAPGCKRTVRTDTCMLIWDHPGKCSEDCGFTKA